jgi:hypothetical protein
MITNGQRTRTNAELTEYQKMIDAIDNVILCVAEAEKMIDAIGQDMARDLPRIEKPLRRRRCQKPPWADQRNAFRC